MEYEKTDRLIEILIMLLRGEEINIKELARKYDVSTKSISRNMTQLRNFLSEHRELMNNSEIYYSRRQKTYILNSDELLKNKELFAAVKILLGSRALNKDEILTIIEKLKRFTSNKDRTALENIIHKEIYHYHEIKSDCPSVINNLWRIITAIENKSLLTITYIKMSRCETKRKIKPVSVMFSEYYFYLIAYMADDGNFKPIYFRIDRITNITEHNEHFELEYQYDFDEGNLREKNQFMFPGENMMISFEFSGLSVQAVLDRLPTAKIVEKRNGISIIEAEVNYGRGIVMYLMSQGAWVKVLSPQCLIDDIKSEAEKIAAYYR